MRLTINAVCFFTILLILLAGGAGICQVYDETRYWPMFHRSEARDGYNAGVETLNALQPYPNRSSLGLIWTFPMVAGNFGTEARRTIDNSEWPSDAEFIATSQWRLDSILDPPGAPDPSREDYFNTSYIWALGVAPATAKTDPGYAEAFFPFPSSLPAGSYKVLVWFPTSPEKDPDNSDMVPNTTSAEYIINASDGTTIRVDQSVGGNWVQIDNSSFHFVPGQGHGVTLTNRTRDYKPATVTDPPSPEFRPVVCADAVLFVPTLNQTVYSSPAADLYAPRDHNARAQSPFYEDTWGPIGAAYIATVEKPRYAVQAGTSYGSIYCVNSDTQMQGTRWYAGQQIWQYPNADPSLRDDLEGPIQGGIFGSPAISRHNHNDPDTEFKHVYVAANDRQVYALDAYTGKLIWKGPGATVSETVETGTWETVAGSGRIRRDTFGAGFLRTPVKDPSNTITPEASVEWVCPATSGLFNGGTGRAYAVYVWLPASEEDRVTDACYEVDYGWDPAATPPGPKTVKVFLDQNIGGAGRWARLGGSQGVYWEVKEVRLLNDTQRSSDDGKFAVADAIMFLPERVEMFGYSNPVVDPNSGELVYVGCSNGRVYALNTDGNTDGTTKEEWVYPNVRTEDPMTPQNADQPAFGPVVASPAVSGNNMYVPSMDGRVYKLSPIDGPTDVVMFPSNDPAADASVKGPATSGFSSSPAVGSNYVCVASIDGNVFSLTPDFATLNWRFPEDTDAGVGAFRYSSPAIHTTGLGERISVGSSDGRVYTLTTAGDHAWDLGLATTDPENTGQDVRAPLQSSVAIDNSTIDTAGGTPAGETVFAGTTAGEVWWMDANNGRMPKWAGKRVGDYVFSSPAVAQFNNTTGGNHSYMYIGSDDGKLYAFSSTVNGGEWTGGDEYPEPEDREDLTQPDATSGVQVQIVDQATYDAIQGDLDGLLGTNPLLNAIKDKNDFDESHIGHSIGQSLRTTVGSSQEVIYEWGDRIYVVVWNLNKKEDMERVEIRIRSSSRTGDADNPGTGGIESGSAPQPGRIQPGRIMNYQAKGYDTDGSTVITIQKGYGTHVFDIPQSWMQQNNNRPPSAGSAWIINVDARVKGGRYRDSETGAVRSSGSVTVSGVVPALPVTSGATSYKPQYISINNPLSIKGPDEVGLAWPSSYVDPSLTDKLARVNGNGASGTSVGSPIPVVDMQEVNHGTNSAILQLGVLDRSKMGLVNQALDRFKISGADLYWRGGAGEVYNPLPWDWAPTDRRGNDLEVFSGLTSSYVGSQMDYPDIRQRYESFRKMSDGGNPVAGHTRLQPAVAAAGATAGSRRVIPDPVEVYVNVPRFQPANMHSDGGYTATTRAYLDMTGNQHFNDGNFVDGEPTAYIEPYRPFRMRLKVPPDYRIAVEETIIDLGKPPHGLGDAFSPWTPFDDSTWFPSYVSGAPSVNWYRRFTVKNLGNINVSNVRVHPWPLMSAQSGIPIYAPFVHSSVDGAYDTDLLAANVLPGPSEDPTEIHRHTISKARVGDSEPTTLSIPDRRRFQWMAGSADFQQPEIGLEVPLTQPIGTYSQLVPISADVYGSQSDPGKATVWANPTFTLKATVRENRMTGGWSDGAHRQVDDPTVGGPAAGNVQPAVFMDAGGNVHMFWSSNRTGNTPLPNDPWYILKAGLPSNGSGHFSLGEPTSPRWWLTAGDPDNPLRLPADQWPPDTTVDMEFGVPGTVIPNTIKHLSPSVAQDPVSRRTWLFWQGQVYRDAGNGRKNQENRVFYMDVTDGATDSTYYSFSRDFAMIKYSPRGLAYSRDSRDWLWAFYYGGDAGRWSVFYNVHNDAENAATHDPTRWSRDSRLPTPASLASVSEPSAVRRTLGADGAHYLDVTYTGMSKESQNNDIYLSRYRVAGLDPTDVRLNVVALPRVRNEVMQRDEKRNTFSSRHIWWVMRSTPDPVNWPVINVMLPGGIMANLTDMTNAELSEDRATGMFVIRYLDNPGDASQHARYEKIRQVIIDPGAGTLRFGRPLEDPKQTWVKISYTPRAMRISSTGKTELSAAVWSGYDEPGDPSGALMTTRWGANPDSDTAAYAILEKTPNTLFSIGAPGGGEADPANLPAVDRLWVFWRKPASGVRATTVFYKTYRLGVQLSKPVAATGLPLEQNDPAANGLTVTGNADHFDVDWMRGRVYFNEKDERYPGLPGSAGQIQVQYESPNPSPTGGPTVTVTDTFETVSWIPEMEEAALLGSASDAMVNEGQVCAFPEARVLAGPGGSYPLGDIKTKMWVFWMSTRTGMADLFYETVSPVFRVYE